MQNIENCDEELVGVLLFVAGEVSSVGPHKMKQLERDVRTGNARVELHMLIGMGVQLTTDRIYILRRKIKCDF